MEPSVMYDKSQMHTGSGKFNLVQLPVVLDARGTLTAIEGQRHIPFDIARVYYLYDIPDGKGRGGHAHRELQQLLIAVSGSITVHVDNGTLSESFVINRPNQGLYLGQKVWRELSNFSAAAVCLVLASKKFEESDYIRDYDQFVREIAA